MSPAMFVFLSTPIEYCELAKAAVLNHVERCSFGVRQQLFLSLQPAAADWVQPGVVHFSMQ
jgi:hypothetical protein